MMTMTPSKIEAFTNLTRHYRHQLDSKNRLIYDLLCRQQVYLARLRDFICRIPDELRRAAHEKLMESLEHLEINFNQSQEEFYELQNVIKNLESGPDSEVEDMPPSPPLTGPSSSSSCGQLPASPASPPPPPVLPRKRSRKISSSETPVPSEPSISAKRRRRKVTRLEDPASASAAAAAATGKGFAPRSCSSSSENANSPLSPLSAAPSSSGSSSSSLAGRWPPSKAPQGASSSFNQLTPKSMVTELELCPNEEDNVLPDFSLFS